MADNVDELRWMTHKELEQAPVEPPATYADTETTEPLNVVAAESARDLFVGIADSTGVAAKAAGGLVASAHGVAPRRVDDTRSSHHEVFAGHPAAPHQTTQVLPTLHVAPQPVRARRRPVWPWMTAAAMLVAGLIIGVLITLSFSDDDTATAAATTTVRPVGTVPASVVPGELDAAVAGVLDGVLDDASNASLSDGTGYRQLDEVIALHTDAAVVELQSQIDAMVVTMDENQVAAELLNDELDDAAAELDVAISQRDVLEENLASMSGSSSDLQTAVADRDAIIVAVRDELAAANVTLSAANDKVAVLRGELDAANTRVATLSTQHDAATMAYTKLDPKPAGTWVGAEVGKARAAASNNNWVIVEVLTQSSTTPVGQVIRQQPAPSATMVNGSVLYVEVAVAQR